MAGIGIYAIFRITVYLLSVHKKMREVLRRFSKHYNKIIEVGASTHQDYPIFNICNILLPEREY